MCQIYVWQSQQNEVANPTNQKKGRWVGHRWKSKATLDCPISVGHSFPKIHIDFQPISFSSLKLVGPH